jgi:hypothetical protein
MARILSQSDQYRGLIKVPSNAIANKTSNLRPTLGTLLLALLATWCISLLRFAGSADPIWLVGEVLLLSGFCCLVRLVWMPRFGARFFTGHPSSSKLWVWGIGACLILTPWFSRWVLMGLFGSSGEATELVALAMLQMAGLWQAAIARTSREDWLSFLISCFLVLFGLASSDRGDMIQIAAPFTILASWWLMARYWDSIEEGFLVSQTVPVLPLRLSILGIMGLGALGFLAWTSFSKDAANRLDGFMPTSGGNKQGESWARQGVGDGDMLIGAKDEAFTFGPVDSDLFLESETPSMYDLVSDLYGETPPKKRRYARAISLDNKIQETEREASESKKNSKEFSAVRQPKPSDKKYQPKGTDSKAIAYVIGETPQWFRIESFDRFESNVWTHSDELVDAQANKNPSMLSIQNKPWMQVLFPPPDLVYSVRERLATKIINFQSPRLLAPSLTTHVHIDRIDQVDFYSWTNDGQLMMPNRDYVPQLTIVHQLYQIPQLHTLRTPNSPYRSLSHQRNSGNPQATHGLGDWIGAYTDLEEVHQKPSKKVRAFLDQVLSPLPSKATDWNRVEAIVGGLRNLRCDIDSVAPEDCSDVVDYLLEQKRGPDYLMATAAVVMIRQMGIPSRLCTGFFASPKRFDRIARQTAIMPEDLHTWAEVHVHGMWVAIEPTGTYPIPRQWMTWQQWGVEMAWACRDYFRNHPAQSLSVALSIAFAGYFRQRLAQAFLSGLSLVLLILPTKFQLLGCLSFLRWKMWVWNQSIPKHSTLQQWLGGELTQCTQIAPGVAREFIQITQRLAYGPAQHKSLDVGHQKLIGQVLRSILFSGLKGAAAPRRISPSSPSR